MRMGAARLVVVAAAAVAAAALVTTQGSEVKSSRHTSAGRARSLSRLPNNSIYKPAKFAKSEQIQYVLWESDSE